MFSCYAHNWFSPHSTCPACPAAVSTSTTITLDPIVGVKKSEYDSLKEVVTRYQNTIDELYSQVGTLKNAWQDTTDRLQVAKDALTEISEIGGGRVGSIADAALVEIKE